MSTTIQIRIRTLRLLGGGAIPSKTSEVLLRFADSVTTVVDGGGRPDDFLGSPSTVLTYLGFSL